MERPAYEEVSGTGRALYDSAPVQAIAHRAFGPAGINRWLASGQNPVGPPLVRSTLVVGKGRMKAPAQTRHRLHLLSLLVHLQQSK